MKIAWWAYLAVGLLVCGVSFYAYNYLPTPSGKPNNAMALFFFVGIIFILTAAVKFLFKRLDDKQQRISFEQQAQPKVSEHKMNRVEAAINQAYAKQPHHQAPQQAHPNHAQHHATHSNQYAQSHNYKGPAVQTPQHHAPQQQAPAHHPHQPTIINCKKCGTKNYSSSNYCHVCGKGLK